MQCRASKLHLMVQPINFAAEPIDTVDLYLT